MQSGQITASAGGMDITAEKALDITTNDDNITINSGNKKNYLN